MALPGSGILPPAGNLFNELSAVTRRAFVPRLFVLFGFASPTWFNLMAGALRSAGGMAPINIPVQGQPMTQGQFTNYAGGFNAPAVLPGDQAASFPTAYWVVPVPLMFGERIIQATDVVISVLKARMNDVWMTTVQNLSPLLFSNNSQNAALPSSFIDGFDNGQAVAVYGNINRNAPGNTNWQGNVFTAPAAVQTNGFTRATMSSQIIKIQDFAGGELPTYGIMSPPDYARLNMDFQGVESIRFRPDQEFTMATSVRTSFPNLNVAGVPIFADHWCPVGTVIFPNKKYTNMFLAEDGAFDFSGFYPLIAVNQMGQQGIVVLGYNVLTAKPSANAIINGIGNPGY